MKPGEAFLNDSNNLGLSGSPLEIGVTTTSAAAAVALLVSRDAASYSELVFFECISFFVEWKGGANSLVATVLE